MTHRDSQETIMVGIYQKTMILFPSYTPLFPNNLMSEAAVSPSFRSNILSALEARIGSWVTIRTEIHRSYIDLGTDQESLLHFSRRDYQ